jgi:hypothetical protein
MRKPKRRVWIFLTAFAVTGGIAVLAGCTNTLTEYLFHDLFYEGWKVSSWSDPEYVVDGETHYQGDEKRNGFPMNMAMGTNGKIHLVGWRVSAKEWVYAVRNPGEERFVQEPFTVIATLDPYNPDGIGLMPGMDLMSDDVPIIAYGSEGVLYFHQYDAVTGWGNQEQLYDASGVGAAEIPHAFVFFSTSDLKTHLFFVAGNTTLEVFSGKLYHTVRTDQGSISPDPPEELAGDVATAHAMRLAGGDVALVYTGTARQNLYYRTFNDPSTETTLYTVPDPSLAIGYVTGTTDSGGRLHVLFGTYDSAAPLTPASYTLHYLRNTGGSWEEKESIEGAASSGPMALFLAPSVDVAPDRHGNDRIHLAFTRVTDPLGFFIHYAYYDETEGWRVSPESVDTVHTNSFWTSPLLAVDPDGEVHIVYSWTQNELNRTMVHVRGTPGEPQ